MKALDLKPTISIKSNSPVERKHVSLESGSGAAPKQWQPMCSFSIPAYEPQALLGMYILSHRFGSQKLTSS